MSDTTTTASAVNTNAPAQPVAVNPAPVKTPISFGAQGAQLASLEDAFRFATMVLKSGFGPKGMDSAESILVALQLGAELGLTPMAALQNTAVINGRPGIFGDAALGLVRASGLMVSYTEKEIGKRGEDGWGYEITTQRKGEQPHSDAFTVADAKAAKLWGKSGPWTDYPKRMLKFRCRGYVLRDVYGDVLKGLRTAEELRDIPIDEPMKNVTPGGGFAAVLAAATEGGAA